MSTIPTTSNITITEEVFCTLQVEGLHNWTNCPLEEVDYLRVPHRHMFHIKAYAAVSHADRDIEFICLKHRIQEYFHASKYWDDTRKLCNFGSMSCEMIARELIEHFNLTECEVSEDGENGARLVVTTV